MRLLPLYLCIVGVTAVACREARTPTGVATLLPQVYTFACERWSPGVPPARRTVLDVLFRSDSTGRARLSDRQQLEVLGGRIIHVFNVPLVRAEVDIGAVPRLWGASPDRHFITARTVLDTTALEVGLSVMLDHDLSDTDIAAVETLGGRVTSRWDALEGYAVVVPDSIVPAVRRLPGISVVGDNFGSGCLF